MNAAALNAHAQRLAGAAPRAPAFALAFLTDRRRADAEAVARALPAGAAVILRDYDLAPRARFGLARRLRAATGLRGVLFLVADDPAMAAAVGADGVHYPAWRLRAAAAHRRVGVVSAACHDGAELRAAAAFADLALLSPVFPTASHPSAPHLGLAQFRELVRTAGLPVLALGGVAAETAPLLAGSGAAGLAAIGAFVGG